MLETLKEWDRSLFVYLNQLGSESFDGFWIFITKIESWTFLFIFFAFLLFKYFPRKKASVIALLTIITAVVSFSLKYQTKSMVARLRPSQLPEWATSIRILQHPTDFSFFSGHASVSMAVTLFLILWLRTATKWIYVLFLWPLLFSFSRIYVGVHYPSDILVGWVVGGMIALIMYYISKKGIPNKLDSGLNNPGNR